ncbi:MAG: hypothetical protein WC483_01105 [Candidatus Paceibacterota bacterium]
MSASYTPPFFSSRQDQPNWKLGTPTYSSVAVGDYSAAETGSSSLAIVKYSVGVYNAWEFASPVPTQMRLSQLVGAATTNIVDFTSSYVDYHIPVHSTAFQAPSFITSDGTASCTDVVGYVNTVGAATADVLSIPLFPFKMATVMVAIVFSNDLVGDNNIGSFTFQFATWNDAGIVSSGAIQNLQSAIPAPFVGATVAVPPLAANITVQVTSATVGVTIRWAAVARFIDRARV